MFFFISIAKSLRGMGPDSFMIIDEMGWMKRDLLESTIFPMLLRKNVSLIGLSTRGASSNDFFSELMVKTYANGRPLCNVLEYKSVCPSCERKGETFSCMHRVATRPWFLNESDDFLKAALGTAAYRREVLNLANTGVSVAAFDPIDVDFLRSELATVDLRNSVFPLMFTCVDPNGGGGCDFAIVTGVFDEATDTCIVRIISAAPCTPRGTRPQTGSASRGTSLRRRRSSSAAPPPLRATGAPCHRCVPR